MNKKAEKKNIIVRDASSAEAPLAASDRLTTVSQDSAPDTVPTNGVSESSVQQDVPAVNDILPEAPTDGIMNAQNDTE